MKEKIEKNNNSKVKQEKQQEEVFEKSESVKNVIKEIVGTYEPEPETHEEELREILSKYPKNVVSDEEKKALMRTAKNVDEFMKKLTVTKEPVIKSAKKGKMKKELQSTIEPNVIIKSDRTKENSSNNRECDTDKIQEI